jgi:hypothetical protein
MLNALEELFERPNFRGLNAEIHGAVELVDDPRTQRRIAPS